MRRSEQYRTAIADYKTATVLPSETDKEGGNRVWRLPLPAGSPVKATVSGRAQMDIITVNSPTSLSLGSFMRQRITRPISRSALRAQRCMSTGP